MMAGRIAVAGASGLVGANIAKAALARGYEVAGAMRDPSGPAGELMALPGAAERLELSAADMTVEGAFDAMVKGADGVFITCLIPVYAAPDGTPARELDDRRGYDEIINPTVNGCLNIMNSAIRAGVKDIVICSSTSSTNPIPPVPLKNEVEHWSDADEQCAAKKYTSATKTVMERAAMALAAEHGVRLCIMLPTMMLGPMVLAKHGDEGFMAALKRMLHGETGRHTETPNDSSSMAHIEDVAALFLAAFENRDAQGRYFAVRESWHWNDIYAELSRIEPALNLPEPFEGNRAAPTGFDFDRRDSLGVPMRDIPEVLADAVVWARSNL
ncbi:MAG: NAD-dependent epimerase/dehydratase family protein [Pseudomonadota bacterium]